MLHRLVIEDMIELYSLISSGAIFILSRIVSWKLKDYNIEN